MYVRKCTIDCDIESLRINKTVQNEKNDSESIAD